MVISAIAEPGDRSMPPVRMTMVEPIATIATIETCSDEVRQVALIEEVVRRRRDQQPRPGSWR